VIKSKAVSIIGHGGLWYCEVLRIPHCLDIWFTDHSGAVNIMHCLYSTPQKHSTIYHSVSNANEKAKFKGALKDA
jgi:hypothetical protein